MDLSQIDEIVREICGLNFFIVVPIIAATTIVVLGTNLDAVVGS